MIEIIQANWQISALVAVIALLLIWWLVARSRKTRKRYHAPDALDAGVAPAARNQALIDAPRTAPIMQEVAPEPVAVPVAVPAAPTGDDLSQIKGVGPKLVTLLGTLGVTSFDQIAHWTAADIADIDARLGVFAGRITRDSWVEQCRFLSAGDVAGFEGRFGRV